MYLKGYLHQLWSEHLDQVTVIPPETVGWTKIQNNFTAQYAMTESTSTQHFATVELTQLNKTW